MERRVRAIITATYALCERCTRSASFEQVHGTPLRSMNLLTFQFYERLGFRHKAWKVRPIPFSMIEPLVAGELAEHTAQDKPNIGRAFRHPPHEIGIPVGSVRHIDTELIALGD